MHKMKLLLLPHLWLSTFSLLLFAAYGQASSSPISILQDKKGIQCEAKQANAAIQRFRMDARDLHLEVVDRDEKKLQFKNERFLDNGVLAVSASAAESTGTVAGDGAGGGTGAATGASPSSAAVRPVSAVLFHILENGTILLTLAERYAFQEQDCVIKTDEKVCQNAAIAQFAWDAEKVAWRGKKDGKETEFTAPIRRYGYFPHDGTYFYAHETKQPQPDKQSLIVLDYGARLHLLIGRSVELRCRYSD